MMTATLANPKLDKELTIPAAKLLDVIGRLRRADPHINAMRAEMFLRICLWPEMTLSQVAASMMCSQSAVTRHINVMSEYGAGKKAGLEWVETAVHPRDERVRIVIPTAKGLRILKTVLSGKE